MATDGGPGRWTIDAPVARLAREGLGGVTVGILWRQACDDHVVHPLLALAHLFLGEEQPVGKLRLPRERR